MKHFLIAAGIFLLFTNCKKEQNDDVDIHWISIEQDKNEINLKFEVLINDEPNVGLNAGFYWGTQINFIENGEKIKVDGYGSFQHTLTNFETSSTYYFQAYCTHNEGVNYFSNVQSINTAKRWKILTNQPPLECRSVAISPDGTVHVVGENGVHFYSNDQGDTWNAITHTTSDDLGSLRFISNDVVYLGVGTNLRKSVDGGMTWSDIANPYNNFDGRCILDANTFFVSNDDSIFKTTNSGATFSSAHAPAGGDYKSLYFLNSSIGYALNVDGYVLKTTNGGTSWSQQNSSAIYGYCKGIWFFDSNTGIVLTEDYVFQTTNGGVTWQNLADLGNQGLTMDFYNSTNGAIGGNWGMLVETSNAGATWQTNYFPEESNESNHIWSLDLLNDTLGFAIDNAGNVIIYQ